MAEISFDLTSLMHAVEHVRATGEANLLGEAIAQGLGEHLEQYLRTLARGAAQAAPSRDQLAAMAMRAWLGTFRGPEDPKPDAIASLSYRMADAMLAERVKPNDH